MENEKPKKKPNRHKPGWGRTFAPNDPYQDDPIYWKLYDIVVLRDPNAIFKIKGSHMRRRGPRTKREEQNEEE